MLTSLAILLSGFSLFSALVIAATHFRCEDYKEQPLARVMGIILLAALAGLQLMHFNYLQQPASPPDNPLYRILLFIVAPAFYLFSKPLLKAGARFTPRQLLHFIPVFFAPFSAQNIALPLTFVIGAGYLLWLARSIYALREQRSRFRLEISILGVVFIIAMLVLALGLFMPLVPEQLFFTLYTIAIGCAFILVSIALGYAPQLSADVVEAAQDTYAVSTLGQVDCEQALQQMQVLLEKDELYKDSQLDLSTLAGRLGLSTHQLSELINTRLGKHFSRYIREYRVKAAQDMLLAEPKASVLSVGLSVGFTSQSNFYEAFREISGTTPGKYRKLHIIKGEFTPSAPQMYPQSTTKYPPTSVSVPDSSWQLTLQPSGSPVHD